MKRLPLLMFLILLCSNLYSQEYKYSRYVYPTTESKLQAQAKELGITTTEIIESEKNPAVAFLFGLIIPGLGQMYNEDLGWGFGLFAGTGLIVLASEKASSDTQDKIIIGGGLIWLISAVVAPFQSQAINRSVRLKKAIRDKKLEKSSLGWLNDIEISPYYSGQSTGISLSYSW